jgi:hypothetical protein
MDYAAITHGASPGAALISATALPNVTVVDLTSKAGVGITAAGSNAERPQDHPKEELKADEVGIDRGACCCRRAEVAIDRTLYQDYVHGVLREMENLPWLLADLC